MARPVLSEDQQPQQRRGGTSRRPSLDWNWANAVAGAVYALPGAAVVLHDPVRGLALTVGVLPAALVGVAPSRRARLAVIALGVLAGIPVAIGGALAGVPVLGVASIALLGVGAALLAARSRLGQIAMFFSLLMVGVGLSYSAGKAAQVGALIVAGSIFACLVSMLWPECDHAHGPQAAAPQAPAPTLGYGIRLGAAGASAAAIGFALDFDHVGWACAAALLVMRPPPRCNGYAASAASSPSWLAPFSRSA